MSEYLVSIHGNEIFMTVTLMIKTSNRMFGRVISDKLPEYIFENFEIAQVKPGKRLPLNLKAES